MSKLVNYLIMKTPEKDLGGSMSMNGKPREVSVSRIIYSFIGLLIGIFLSFFITGFSPTPSSEPTDPVSTEVSTTTQTNEELEEPSEMPSTVEKFDWKNLWKIGIITLVICGLTYQGLYNSLKLYINEPAFLTIFIAFQYGFFWQSLVNGGASLI